MKASLRTQIRNIKQRIKALEGGDTRYYFIRPAWLDGDGNSEAEYERVKAANPGCNIVAIRWGKANYANAEILS